MDNNENIQAVLEECAQYRETLIRNCQKYFKYDYQAAEDCVSEAYLSLAEALNNGIEIHNYYAWLYKVTLNKKNQAIKKIIRRNEMEFSTNEIKDAVLENYSTVDSNIDNISEQDSLLAATKIFSTLSDDERKLYIEYYRNGKKLKDIAKEWNVSNSAMKKRNERLKKKLKRKVKEYFD